MSQTNGGTMRYPSAPSQAATTTANPTTTPSQSYAAAGQRAGGEGWGGPFPSLHMWPIQDTFAMKMIHLPEGQKIKIGRQTNTKTVPGERNAYFDSKVLSRTHAEIWESRGKIFIKDVKSSNGTFVNSDRLSAEGVESQPYELHSEDMVEFGIDIAGEDNRTIMHHKVAAKVYCVFNAEDAALSARELNSYQNHDPRARRPNGQPQVNQLAQMGPSVMSAGGKAGISFEHVLHKLQAELAKSKETGAELQNLTGQMNDIQDTLGGGLPPSQNGSAASFIPPQFRLPLQTNGTSSVSPETQQALSGPHGAQAAAFLSLQSQLADTQSTLSSQLDRIRGLEEHLRDTDGIKHEVGEMRGWMEDNRNQLKGLVEAQQHVGRGRQMGRFGNGLDEEEDDDDARSVMTMMEDEDGADRVRARRRVEDPRPATPEPGQVNGHRPIDGDEDREERAGGGGPRGERTDLTAKVEALGQEVTEALALNKALLAKHDEAMALWEKLNARVDQLESGLASRVVEELGRKAEERWEGWRTKTEEGWKKERESWEAERERLRGVVREWEEASRRAEEEEEDRKLNSSLSEGSSGSSSGSSGDEGIEGVEGAGGDEVGKIGEGMKVGKKAGSRRKATSRRRRPSQKVTLAVRGLKGVAGDLSPDVGPLGIATPKSTAAGVMGDNGEDDEGGGGLRMRGSARGGRLEDLKRGEGSGKGVVNGGGRAMGRTGSAGTVRPGRGGGTAGDAGEGEEDDEEAGSEGSGTSGKESGDTLKEGDEGEHQGKLMRSNVAVQPIPIFTVLVVAVAAGALYLRHKE